MCSSNTLLPGQGHMCSSHTLLPGQWQAQVCCCVVMGLTGREVRAIAMSGATAYTPMGALGVAGPAAEHDSLPSLRWVLLGGVAEAGLLT
jgi:hypothetical protein